jgi:glycosyltransferase involved in cell wall biosynthesis
MRILQVISNLSIRAGGPPRAARQLSQALAARGHDVTIYTTDAEFDGGRLSVTPNVAHQEDGYTVHYFSREWRGTYGFSWRFLRAIGRSLQDFDVVHIHSVFFFTTLVACAYAQYLGVPYIMRPHGTFDPFLMKVRKRRKQVYLHLIERRNLDCAFAIHYTAEDEARLAAPLGIKAPAVVVPLGVDLDVFSSAERSNLLRERFPSLGHRRLVIFYGRINFKKGLNLLIPAFAKLIETGQDAHLFIVGPDNEGYSDRVRRWVAERSLGERVTILPPVDGMDRARVLQSADAFVLPSYTENFGLSVVEAMAVGTPVVISDRVNIHREVASAGAGIVTGVDVNQIAAAMRTVLSDPGLSRHMGERGQALVNERYTWPSVARQMEGVYREALRVKGNTHLQVGRG